jgi:Ca2+-transporting ATPase
MNPSSECNTQQQDQPSSSRPAWHTRKADTLLRELRTDPDSGLTSAESRERLRGLGANEIRHQRRRTPWRMFADQFTDFMILVLIAAAIVSGIVGDPSDTVAIIVIIVLNAIIGFVQEYRAERAVAALKRMAAPSAQVRRDGQTRTVNARELVPGDIVALEAGNIVPADVRLLETADLQADESALTGESQPAAKATATLDDSECPLAERNNMAFKGTSVTRGRGSGVVVDTGMKTELGRIATLLRKEEQSRTPLQKRLGRFGRRLAIAVLVVCAIIFAAGLLRGEPVTLMFLTAVSLAVAAIPEALPAVVTISLALGARKLVKRNALIRRLPAVETLGSVTYICSDKTGTLTENRMRVQSYYVDGQRARSLPEISDGVADPWHYMAHAMALNNDAKLDDTGRPVGDPTEVALFEAALERGWERTALEQKQPRQDEIPFDAERKRMTTLHRRDGEIIAYTKGAPEYVLDRCSNQLISTGVADLDPQTLIDEADKMAGEGYRVLALAMRTWTEMPDRSAPEQIEEGLTFLGLVALMDPPRAEAGEAVRLCKSAGITPVMVTGDHPDTARAIAARIGIGTGHEPAVTGRELNANDVDHLNDRVLQTAVYARVDPQQKIDIVKALQRRHQFVAMTGDGVNDAPALKRADIGVAMGRKGTDVAREAADMVLLDDNFATIVTAVREGRRIYDNIRKFVKYTMTSNSGEIWTLFLAPFLGLPIPLLPIHILWINLVTDGLPGLALSVEPEEPGIMQRPPRPPHETLFAHGMWQHILWVGLLIGGLSLLTQAWALNGELAHWQTMVFTVLTLSQLVHVLVIRSERESLFKLGLRSNLPLLGAVVLTVVLQLATIYLPILNPIFKTQPLGPWELAYCLGLPWVVFVAVELEKWAARRGWIYAVGTVREKTTN